MDIKLDKEWLKYHENAITIIYYKNLKNIIKIENNFNTHITLVDGGGSRNITKVESYCGGGYGHL